MTVKTTQTVLEAMAGGTGNALVTQVVAEVPLSSVGVVETTQSVLEVMVSTPTVVKVCQAVLEVLVNYVDSAVTGGSYVSVANRVGVTGTGS
jgi:hypothetical protein